jgi:uncharacterized protein YbgA (DUF1722 family)/uncharacterized protein YbbK (DUF523 family)
MKLNADKIKIGISSCLLGEPVRYDGGHKHDRYITDVLGQFFQWVPICPEVECGLPVPREAMHLVGDPASPRLVTIHSDIDHTEGMKKWAEKRLKSLAEEGICGFIFKSRSPSSGMQGVKVYSEKGMPAHKGVGIFAAAFMKRFPLCPVEDDGRLNDQRLRENFIERIFVFNRWQLFLENGGSFGKLVNFHTNHKFLILSHSTRHYTALGRLVAQNKENTGEINDTYIRIMMDGLRLMATNKKNANVLQHMAGYFKKQLSADEKLELDDIIEQYRKELMPLVVPVTLINHYVRKYNEPYLKIQHYLNPHPMELKSKNHA